MPDQMLYQMKITAPLAVDARTAKAPGTCCLCRGRIRRGDRIATVNLDGEHLPAHVSCVAGTPGKERTT